MEKLSELLGRRVNSLIFKFVGILGTADGIVAAACISGLPAGTCRPMAIAYVGAIDRLVFAAVLAFLAFNFGAWALEAVEFAGKAKSARWRRFHRGTSSAFYLAALVLTLASFFATGSAATHGTADLQFAIEHCFSS